MATAPFQLWVDLPSVVSAIRVSSTVTVTTSAAHGLTTGTYVQLEGLAGAAGTSMNGVHSATVTSGTTFTVDDSGTAGTATAGSAVVSRDLLTPLIDYAANDRQAAAYAIPESLTMSASGDGNTSSISFSVAQDDTPSDGPWWANIPDQARVRLYKAVTGTAPTDADLYFIGIVANIVARLNGAGQGSIADIAVDEVNAILDKLVVVGRPIGTVNPIDEDGFVRSSNTVTVTTSSSHNFFIGLKVGISGVIGGGGSMNGTFTVASVPGSRTFTYSSTGANGTGDQRITPSTAALKSKSLQIVVLTFSSAHNLKSGETVILEDFICTSDKFTSQINTSFSGSSMKVTSSTAIEIKMSGPLNFVQTVSTKGTVQGVAKITPIGAQNAQQNFVIAGGQSEDAAVQTALSRINSFKDEDYRVQRLLNTAGTADITGAGVNSANSRT